MKNVLFLSAVVIFPVMVSAADKLLTQIDCVIAEPEQSQNRSIVESGPAGAYRSSKYNFQYRIQVPQSKSKYRIELDYPDDFCRMFSFSVFDPKKLQPLTSVMIQSGNQFFLSQKMQTAVLKFQPDSTEFNLKIVSNDICGDGKAVLSAIRLYQDDDANLSNDDSKGKRIIRNFMAPFDHTAWEKALLAGDNHFPPATLSFLPAGRNELMIPALELACTDAFHIDGIASDSEAWNTFKKNFSALKQIPFRTILGDPVAVRTDDNGTLYMVNGLPVPVKVSVQLEKLAVFFPGKAVCVTDNVDTDVSGLELKPYELKTFKINSKVLSASFRVRDDYAQDLFRLSSYVLNEIKDDPAFKDLAKTLGSAIRDRQFITQRLLLKINEKRLTQYGLSLSTLYSPGYLPYPDDAIYYPVPSKKWKSIPAKNLFPDWFSGVFRIGQSISYNMSVKETGTYNIQAFYLIGSMYSPIGIRIDGANIARLTHLDFSVPKLISAQTKIPVQLSEGKHTVEFFHANGHGLIGLYYFRPVLQKKLE